MQVSLIESMGTDLTVVNAARVSFSKESEWEYNHNSLKYELKQDDAKLINYLAKHSHWTPFSHPQIMMREKVPIFVARQRFKHMVGFTYNEVSRRYVDDTPEFYDPVVWRSRPEGSVKQGSGNEIITNIKFYTDPHSGAHTVSSLSEAYEDFIETTKDLYTSMLEAGVAPEQARMVLPQSMYTEYYVTGSLAAWARAYKQRIDDHAQKEIQDLARSWDKLIRPLYPKSWEALTE